MNAVNLVRGAIIFLLLQVLLGALSLLIFEAASPNMAQYLPTGPYPGDTVIPDAVMVYDQTRLIHAPPEAVWPWVLQVGKGRGGWYAPVWFERFLPQNWHSSRTINPSWQQLRPGDRVDDYGVSPDDYFIVSDIQPGKALVYNSDRYGAHFSW